MAESGRFGRFEISLAERRLLVDGTPIALGSRAFDLLAALVARRDRVVPKEELITVVWPGLVVEDNNLQVQISALRKVMGAPSIATVPGRGYQFTVAATPASAGGAGDGASPASNLATNLASAALNAALRAPDRAHLATRKSRLLVADDNKVNRLLLCRSLELMGHEVASAENGRLALQKLRGEHFDMLLLDLEMPEMDGFALLGVRADDPVLRELPVIVTSSIEGAAQVARCIELGADDFLHKPVNPMLLKARVDSSLERKHLRDRERELLARLAPPQAASLPAPGEVQAARTIDPATVLTVRLHDLDALASTSTPQDALETLSGWSTLMVDAVESHGGVVCAFAGDAITAAFGTATTAPAGDAGAAAWQAVQSALEMRELATGFNAEREATGKAPVEMAIGIATGPIVAGQAGASRRAVYVCIGSAVQRAAALESMADAAGGSVWLDASTQAAIGDRTTTLAQKSAVLPGAAKPVGVHALKPG